MLKFLIIDDDTKQIHFFAKFLKKEFPNSIVLSALNGKEGIELATREIPDLILLDLLLPGMGGFEILKVLRKNKATKDIPVIVITANLKGNEYQTKALTAGADYFITHPENINQLLPQIKSLLRRHGYSFTKMEEEHELYKTFLTQEIQSAKDREKALKEALYEIRQAHDTIRKQNDDLSKQIAEKDLILKKLKESEQKFKLIFDSAFGLIFLLEIKDNGIKISDVNQIALEKLGYEKEELLGRELTEIYQNNSEEVTRQILKANLEITSKIELTHKTKKGEPLIVEAEAKPLRLEDKTLIYLHERDITSEVEMLNKLKMFAQIIQYSPVSVVITDIDGKVEFANQNHLETTGYSEEEIIGSTPCILSIDYYDEASYRELWNRLKGGDVWIGEFKSKKKEGETFWVLAAITPIVDKDGVIKKFAIISQDISEQKELIEELKIARAEAEKSDRLKSEFLARISHEIRTPLNTIINFTQILFEELPDIENEILEISKEAIIDASKRIERTINLILETAQIETGAIELQTEEFDLVNDCLNQIISEYTPRIKKKKLTLNFKVDTSETRITADRYTVHQIFANLIDNAVKFTQKGSIDIFVYLNDSNKLTVTIKDTGIGISDEYLPYLFKPFTQEEVGYSRKFEGTGLGLFLVKKYCELNNAELQLYSKKGEGTKVTVVFN